MKKSMLRRRSLQLFIVMLLFSLLFMSLTACGGKTKTKNLAVTIVNRSLLDIAEVYISSVDADDWGDTLIKSVLADGDQVNIDIGDLPEEAIAAGFNISASDQDGNTIYGSELDEQKFTIRDGDCLVFLPPESDMLLDITRIYKASEYDDIIYEFLNYRDDSQGLGDITDFVGCWKYDEQPYYFLVGEEFEWMAISLYGDVIGPCTFDTVEDGIELYWEDGSVLTTLFTNGVGSLIDIEGNTLTASENILLLPTAEDELNMVANFPGSFSNVQISYPVQMNANESANMSEGLSFNAEMEYGTDDYYSNITVSFQPISGYDEYMTQGLGTAKPMMQNMLNDFLSSMFGDKIIKTIGSDCQDYGSYYSIAGYVWLDGSIFADGPSAPVRGTMEVRYYGPTGYAMVGTAIAQEHRIQNYYGICTNMLNSCTYSAGWSTAPKPVPSAPLTTPQGAPVDASDPGDYSTPYSWYDEDGDVWYWNGYENIFIGFGGDYYIDEDGEYYESNDAGWDYDWDDYYWDYDYYDDYDPWSDPGDGEDAWSDPGDYYYDDYDDGWGDYFEYSDEGWGDYVEDEGWGDYAEDEGWGDYFE